MARRTRWSGNAGRWLRLASLALLASLWGSAALSQAPAEPFRVRLDVRGIDLWVGLSNGRGRPVTAPSLASITVTEDGKPQEIDAVFPAAEVPLSLAILLDTSATMTDRGAIDAVTQDLVRFLDQTLTATDAAALYTFRETLVETVPFGRDAEALQAGLRAARLSAARPTFEGTAVRDVLAEAFDRLADQGGRRAVLVITDGRDNGSHTVPADLVERARRSRLRVYVLLVGRRQLGTELATIAEETGGRMLRSPASATVSSALRAIRRDLTDQWIVSYRSSHAGDSRCRALQLTAHHEGRALRVRSPSGYCPSSSPSFSPPGS